MTELKTIRIKIGKEGVTLSSAEIEKIKKQFIGAFGLKIEFDETAVGFVGSENKIDFANED